MTGIRKKKRDDHYTRDEDPCENLKYSARIQSPKKEVISRLKKGDILLVAWSGNQSGGYVAVLWQGEIAGAITERVDRLSHCIKEGVSYEAEVLSVRGGLVEVEIRPSR